MGGFKIVTNVVFLIKGIYSVVKCHIKSVIFFGQYNLGLLFQFQIGIETCTFNKCGKWPMLIVHSFKVESQNFLDPVLAKPES